MANEINVDTQKIVFTVLESGSKELDAIYFIKLIFTQYDIPIESQIKILEFLRPETIFS